MMNKKLKCFNSLDYNVQELEKRDRQNYLEEQRYIEDNDLTCVFCQTEIKRGSYYLRIGTTGEAVCLDKSCLLDLALEDNATLEQNN